MGPGIVSATLGSSKKMEQGFRKIFEKMKTSKNSKLHELFDFNKLIVSK